MTKSIGFIPQQTQISDYGIYTGKCVIVGTPLATLDGLVERVSNGTMFLKLEKDPKIVSNGSNTATIKTEDISVISPSIILYGADNKPVYSNK
ncbi:hypothetical protein KAT80_03480 [Candidatus Pacearchaeota archaeon]|nr:hypothetical protein [Candidatus Pacearchaeota archaeon]